MFTSLTAENLHHAYCLSGEPARLLSRLVDFLEGELDISIKGNPNIWQGIFETVGIDEARTAKEFQEKHAVGGGRKICIFSASRVTPEAQNALLKVFEEPTPHTHFFMILSSASLLLPTLRSRLVVLEEKSSIDDDTSAEGIEAKKFLASSKGERLSMVAPMIKEKNRDELRRLTDALTKGMYKGKFFSTEESTKALSQLVAMRNYVFDSASSVKLIAEHLALVLPVEK